MGGRIVAVVIWGTCVLVGSGTGFAAPAMAGTGSARVAVAARRVTTPPPLPPTPFVHPPEAGNPDCVIEIQSGDSLDAIAEAIPDTAVSFEDLQMENGIDDADHIESGDYLDICVGNQIDDISGDQRDIETGGVLDEAVAAQQRKLNGLFAGYGMPELAVDGVSGPLTRQQLCAARVVFGLPVSRSDMVPASAEEQFLMEVTGLPAQSADADDRWIVIDKTCQIMFVGARSSIVFVFPTSTGEAGYETRDLQGVPAFRFDPALDNDGWHDSTTFPAAADNPLNGNMYKPLYFNDGQAIHGSYNVPPEPKSKGCARLIVEDQDTLLAWLALADAAGPVWSADRINVSVSVQGQF